ncbi:ATP-dependent zinc protease [Tenacibaculum sp. IB213877]|uniref:ATP-dependent zinc protease family protein n=1 Tax=Tenacibaculum sp. IB213877 TaxID=3097351 RepID=UPI002A5A8708|nr:RimK/LysX family protein [Tenacibaculum sp. IB213877]MDY0780436.1 RimK/LysX family protein [Tenacibaculum sp. IB213877]
MKIIGRVETATFPVWKIEDLPVKVDTGAYTSSIHCKHIVEKDGYLEFKLLCPQTEKYNNKLIKTANYQIKSVRSSNGKKQKRYIVKTTILFFGKRYRVQFSLANRSKMNYPVLLGRKFLTKKFIVDVSKKNIAIGED